MAYKDTLDYLYSRLPMFHRVGASAYKGDLSNTLAICDLLGHPEQKFKSIHIAGTNGKGSTSHMLAAILQTAGYKTGLYTSPHLKDFRERIRINGQMIPENYVVSFVQQYRKEFEQIEPSFFEWTVGLAFDYFASEKVDIAVIETGMGGRLDSTNVVIPVLSVITNIGFDHTQFLGDTKEKIAWEKAGIIKPGIPVVISEKQEETTPVFIQKAADCKSEITFASDKYKVGITVRSHEHILVNVFEKDNIRFQEIKLDLPGNYQKKNLAGVLLSTEILKTKGFKISDQHIKDALSSVKELTGFKGRWYKIADDPLTIADTAHNADGVREITDQLKLFSYNKLHYVFGAVQDKDISEILALLPGDAVYYFCRPDLPRALDVLTLAESAGKAGLKGTAYSSVSEALHAAQAAAKKDDLVLVGGSTFVVAEII